MSTTAQRSGSGVARIGIAVALSSVAGYALLTLVGRALSPEDFGLFVAFWGVLFGLGSSLSTIEQEAARGAASQAREADGPPASAVTVAAASIVGLVAAVTLVPPVAHRIYGESDSRIGLLVVLGALGFAVQFAVRGQLIGSGAVPSYSRLLVVEPATRLVVLGAVLLAVGVDLRTAAVAVAVGSFAWLGWSGRARTLLHARDLSTATWRAATGRAGSLMAGAALTASVITGFPTLVTALTGSPGAAGGAVFAALTVSRVPLLLVSPVQAVTVPFIVRTRESSGPNGVSRLRKGLALGTLLFAAVGAAGAAAAWVVGPWLIRLVYGNAYHVPGWAVAVLILSACLLAWAQLLSAALIGLAAHRRMLTMWGAGVVLTVAWLAASPLDVVGTTAFGSLAAPLGALACGIPVVLKLSGDVAGSDRGRTVTGVTNRSSLHSS